MKKMIIGSVAAAATFLTPIAAYAQTEVEFWHAFTGRLGHALIKL